MGLIAREIHVQICSGRLVVAGIALPAGPRPVIPVGAIDLNFVGFSPRSRPGLISWWVLVCCVVHTLRQAFDTGLVEVFPSANGRALSVLSFSAANKVLVS